MTYAKIIEYIKRLRKFAEKNYELPFIVRRAIKKNHKALLEEYKLYDEEYQPLVADYESKTDEEKEEINKKVMEMLNTETDLQLETVSVMMLADVNMTLADEELIDFMLVEE